MFNKANVIGAIILVLLGFLLAVGYPKGGVKNTVKYSQEDNSYIQNLTKEGNAKNFIVRTNLSTNKLKEKIHAISHKTKLEVNSNKTNEIYSKSHIKEHQTIRKVKRIAPKPIKRKIKLVAPPPPSKEEEDEGC